MNSNQYLVNSEKTLAGGKLHHEGISEREILATIQQAIEIGTRLDEIKKKLFYNKPLKTDQLKGDNEEFSSITSVDTNILHSFLGIHTESVELLQALMDDINGVKKMDPVNIIEELGDICWYLAIPLRKFKVSFETVWSVNIKKLLTRFKSKFSIEDANVRDLESEYDTMRKALEK